MSAAGGVKEPLSSSSSSSVFDASTCTALLECASALSSIADAVAAISCEALEANVSPFSLVDSGDGTSDKDVVAVAADFRVFFNGSGRVKADKPFSDPSVANIPLLHGSFREETRRLQKKTRLQLTNQVNALLSLARDLVQLGRMSAARTQLLLAKSIPRLSELKSAANCPRIDALEELLASAPLENDVTLFVYELMIAVIKIVSWEGIVAIVSLEGSGSGSSQDKLGKGTRFVIEFIKERLNKKAVFDLEKFTTDFLALVDPAGPGSAELVTKLKEIVENNESRRLPKVAKGTKDISGEQMAIRMKAKSEIVDVFKRHGSVGLDTPVFELRETLMGKYGEDSKLIYDLADQGGELCSLRYDLTVPFARFVAMNGLSSYKSFQDGKVFRRDNPSKGRSREFCQFDFNIAGPFENMGPDFEVIKTLTEVLDVLEIGEYEVKLNHRKLLDGMMGLCGVSEDKMRTICSSIDKLDKLTFEKVKEEMVEKKGLSVETADKIGTFVKKRGSPVELLSELRKESSELLASEAKVALDEALDELEILFKALAASNCLDRVIFDLSLARGLDYYTGVIFEAVSKGDTQVGSIAGGGRFDKMIGMFGKNKKEVPAVGFGLGFERVLAILEEIEAEKDMKQKIRATETQVLVSYLGKELSVAAELVSKLWEKKISAECMVNKRKPKQVDRAKGSRIPYMVIVGERELSKNTVILRDVAAETEEEVPRSGLLEKLEDVLKT